jgi:hypothetical protein
MASVTLTPITCPNCRRPFTVQLQQIFDTNQDPQAKQKLMRYRPTVARCPSCGYNGPLSTPLLYHDAEKQLLIVYVPIELGLRQNEQERLVGDLTNKVINALPAELRKGYLLQPRFALSYQGMIDQILAADGITPEMVNEQRARIDLIDRLLNASETELPALAAANDARLDMTFFQLLTASIESAAASGQTNVAQQLAALRERLLPMTAVGKRAARQSAAIQALQQAGGEQGVSVELVLEHLIKAEDESIVEALVAAARPLVDYNLYMLLAERIGQAEGRGDKAESERLKALREKLLAFTAELDKRNRAVLDRAAQTLRAIAQAPDIQQAIQEHAEEIDDAFMAVLEANIEAAQQAGQMQTVQRLQGISDAIMQLMQASAPPEIQFLNEVLSIENPAEQEQFLRKNGERLTPELLSLLSDVADQMRENGRADAAERLDQLRGKIGNIIAFG